MKVEPGELNSNPNYHRQEPVMKYTSGGIIISIGRSQFTSVITRLVAISPINRLIIHFFVGFLQSVRVT